MTAGEGRRKNGTIIIRNVTTANAFALPPADGADDLATICRRQSTVFRGVTRHGSTKRLKTFSSCDIFLWFRSCACSRCEWPISRITRAFPIRLIATAPRVHSLETFYACTRDDVFNILSIFSIFLFLFRNPLVGRPRRD